jgi:lysozyme
MVGQVTIGVGVNLSEGMPGDILEELFHRRFEIAVRDAIQWVGLEIFHQLTPARRAAVVSLAYNLGLPRLKQFVKTRAAIGRGDYTAAAQEMLDSRWAQQVGDRAVELSHMMESGDWPTVAA